MYRTAVVGAFLVSSFAASVISPWHAGDRVRVAEPAAPRVSAQQMFDDRLAAAMTRYGCTPPQMWKATRTGLPTSMLLKPAGTYRLVRTAWTYPPPPNHWTLALCAN